jgi:hypothetical protein
MMNTLEDGSSKELSMDEISPVSARFVRVKLLEAHWEEDVPDEWKSSVALSEFMLYRSGTGKGY